jgi:alanine dehydrogenase
MAGAGAGFADRDYQAAGVAIDQGGCAETSRPTTHSHPTYIVDEVVHYCVTNMPGAVPRTSTFALNNATTAFILALADKGWRRALEEDPNLRNGLNVHNGQVTCRAVADALNLPYTPAEQALKTVKRSRPELQSAGFRRR